MNAPPAAPARDAAFLALVLADALKLGLPDPDYITMSVSLAGSTTTSAIDFQFNGRNGQDPLPRLRAWAMRFGAGVRVSTYPEGSPKTWHEFSFTHSGVLFHGYAEIAGAPADDEPLPDCGRDGCGHPEAGHRISRGKPVADGKCLHSHCTCAAYQLRADDYEATAVTA